MEPLAKTRLELLQAFNRDDLGFIAERVDPEVTYCIPGRVAVSGDFRGIDAVVGAFRRLRELSGGTISVEPGVVLSDDDHVMFTGRVTAHHEGRSLDVLNSYVFRFRHGRLLRGQLFPGDQHAIEAFFG